MRSDSLVSGRGDDRGRTSGSAGLGLFGSLVRFAESLGTSMARSCSGVVMGGSIGGALFLGSSCIAFGASSFRTLGIGMLGLGGGRIWEIRLG